MRVSFRWLKELLDMPNEMGPRDVAERLTLVGLQVEGLEELGGNLKNIVVGNILTREKHPNADSLSVTTVDVGEAAPLQIVCGASNCDVGKLVPVAREGAVLPGGLVIGARELRGVKSQGMLCSGKELGIAGGDQSGLLILEGTPALGIPVARALGMEDFILDISVTPNRPDAMSHVGVARDLAASLSLAVSLPTGSSPTPHFLHSVGSDIPESGRRIPITSSPSFRVKTPSFTCAERGGPVDDVAQVKVDEAVRCPRYTARVIEGVTVGTSPAWLQRRLEACGMRSINNIVDITNLVMLERGHPLHAFDIDKLALDRGRPTVVVRMSKPGEKLTTLDGVERVLNPCLLYTSPSPRD